jgi:hypothetical protein
MMIPERPALERRILAALDATAASSRIPVLLGGCGSGRTSALLRVRELLGRSACQYVDVERIATTPERFLRALRGHSPFPAVPATAAIEGAREAFDASLRFLDAARAPGGTPATFLLDETLELRTFESFPGLRTVLRDLVTALAASSNRFVLTSRYQARTLRLLRDAPPQFEVMHVAPLTAAEIRATLPVSARAAGTLRQEDEEDRRREDTALAIHALSGGRPVYARAIGDMLAQMAQRGGGDPVSALAALLSAGGQIAATCRFSYELRLHRARGYGALKAILDVLSEEEPLTLTEIAQRLHRTPGSTKDYLSWLEDVDLIVSRQKRYSFADPVLRVWVRLYGRPVPPADEDVAREVQGYALARLPQLEPAMALAGAAPQAAERDKPWGIIEID